MNWTAEDPAAAADVVDVVPLRRRRTAQGRARGVVRRTNRRRRTNHFGTSRHRANVKAVVVVVVAVVARDRTSTNRH